MTKKKRISRTGPLAATVPSAAIVALGALACTAALLGMAEAASAQSRGAVRHSAFDMSAADHSVRDISDQDHARVRRERGQLRPFEELMQKAAAVGRGQYLGVEPNISNNVYRFKFMRPGGNLIWVDVDGRTGRVLAERR